MTFETDPWERWYGNYVARRAALKAARLVAQERARTANVVAGLLLAFMLVGGIAASVAVGIVLVN